MSTLKEQLIRLGHERPELRDHLKPVLDKVSNMSKTARKTVKADVLVFFDELITAARQAGVLDQLELDSFRLASLSFTMRKGFSGYVMIPINGEVSFEQAKAMADFLNRGGNLWWQHPLTVDDKVLELEFGPK